MLFNSYAFILAFLPVVLLGFFLVARFAGQRAALAVLAAGSLFYYGYWNPRYVLLIVASIAVNHVIGNRLAGGGRSRHAVLVAGLAFNLGLLGYFKYANFFVANTEALLGTSFHFPPVVLPLAISFFTFQQIAFLVDAYRGQAGREDFLDYCLFITFFPQLIAGPIVHHKEMMPQFTGAAFRFDAENFGVGLTLFCMGLFKKVMIADTTAVFATPVFAAAATGAQVSVIDAWGAALAYTFQLYFDFSGYSDMAVGLARMVGIRLPINFDSPYKAPSIRDFWRRWHITLSRFLRDYLYIPLGGNRKGPSRRYANLMITMLLGGFWHGAGWTFVLWGGLHGLYLVINDLWCRVRPEHSVRFLWPGRVLTFVAVVAAWVVFRADTVDAAGTMLAGMAGLHGLVPPPETASIHWGPAYGRLAALLAAVWLLPNSYQLLRDFQPVLTESRALAVPSGWAGLLRWRLTRGYAYLLALVAVTALANMTEISEFLYFRF